MLRIRLTTCDVWITFWAVFNLIETLFLSIESFQLNHVESVNEKIWFYCMVKRTITTETWAKVYFNKPWFQIRVKQDVEPKNFKTICSMHLVFLLGLYHVALSTSHSLYDNIKNPGPKQRHVNSHCLQMLTESRETPLESEIIMFRGFILNKILILLVDWVIGKMHVLIVFIEFGCISFRRETC